MNIKTVQFVKGVIGPDRSLEDGKPQIAFIGRSNVGKSSMINSLTKQKNLARTSSFPGRTQEANLFLINNTMYMVDLPGYGFAKSSHRGRGELEDIISWYLFNSGYEQKKVVLIVDASIGLTDDDQEMIQALEEAEKNFIVIANKVDKIKQSELKKRLLAVQHVVGKHKVIPYSSHQKMPTAAILDEIFG